MDRKLRAIIVDDEERARRVLNNLLERYCPDVDVVANCAHVSEAILAVEEFKPDAIFLDIEMPEFSGFELIERLGTTQCDIVFVTAYNKYAVQAFEVSAIDYVLKPVSIEKLEQAVEKIKKSHKNSQIGLRLKALEKNLENNDEKRLVLPSKIGYDYIKVNDITHINADGSYCDIYLKDGKRLVVSKKMKFFENKLVGTSNFYRCHRSHIINLDRVRSYRRGNRVVLMENDFEVSVSRDKKGEIYRELNF